MSQQIQVPVFRVIEHLDFMLGDVEPLLNGDRRIRFVTRTGDVLAFTVNEQAAQQLGKQLLAPRLAVADGLPENGGPGKGAAA